MAKFLVGQIVKLKGYEHEGYCSCEVNAKICGVDLTTELEIVKINEHDDGEQFLYFAEPYKRFCGMTATRFEVVK